MGVFILITILTCLVEYVLFVSIRKRKNTPCQGPAIQVTLTKSRGAAFEISLKGELHNKQPDVTYKVLLSDETRGIRNVIRSEIGSLNETGDLLSIESPVFSLGEKAKLNEWTKIITLPADKIKPSRSGLRKLMVQVEINETVTTKRALVQYDWEDKGFLDIEERLDEIYTAIFYLLAGLRSFIPYETAITPTAASWLQENGSSWTDEQQAHIARQFERIVVENDGASDWKDACENYSRALRIYADKETRHRMMQLFFQALDLFPDAITEEQRLTILFELSKSTGSDMGQFCRMAERVFPESYLKMDHNELFGIHDEMTKTEISQRLRDEYKVWNARITHPNKKLRKNAETMLNLIAQKRCELVED